MSKKIFSFSVADKDLEFVQNFKEECRKNYVSFSRIVVEALREYYKKLQVES